MGETQSKSLAERHGNGMGTAWEWHGNVMGTAWERNGICESALIVKEIKSWVLNLIFTLNSGLITSAVF
jgi:hypothetical protein